MPNEYGAQLSVDPVYTARPFPAGQCARRVLKDAVLRVQLSPISCAAAVDPGSDSAVFCGRLWRNSRCVLQRLLLARSTSSRTMRQAAEGLPGGRREGPLPGRASNSRADQHLTLTTGRHVALIRKSARQALRLRRQLLVGPDLPQYFLLPFVYLAWTQ